MKIIKLVTAVLLVGLSSSNGLAAKVEVQRVWHRYRNEASFTRIAEYFGAPESVRPYVTRSQLDSRSGYYFSVKLKASNIVSDAIVVLEYIVPNEEAPRVKFFPLKLESGSFVGLFGLTGTDWVDKEAVPVAWCLRVLNASGTEIARERSFTWSLE
jgi:hypothetical protein